MLRLLFLFPFFIGLAPQVSEKGEFLFNLVEDPGEENNLKDKYPSVFARQKKKYGEWESQVLKPVPL